MPELDGLAATGPLRATAPGTAVIILTTFHDDAYIAEALGAGASGFLVKSGDPRELIAALRAVARGASYLSPEVAHRVIAQLGPDRLARAAAARERVARLTGREHEVLALLAEGLPNAKIAQRLYLVEGTVKAYVSAILTGLGARNRVEAAITAYDGRAATVNAEVVTLMRLLPDLLDHAGEFVVAPAPRDLGGTLPIVLFGLAWLLVGAVHVMLARLFRSM